MTEHCCHIITCATDNKKATGVILPVSVYLQPNYQIYQRFHEG